MNHLALQHVIPNSFEGDATTVARELLRENLARGVMRSKEEFLHLFEQEQQNEISEWFEQVVSYNFLTKIIATRDFNELILFSGTNGLLISRDQKEELSFPLTNKDYQLSLECFSHQFHEEWNYAKPFASFKVTLCNKSFRLTLIHYSLTADKKSKLYLRSVSANELRLEDLKLEEDEYLLLKETINAHHNVIISGATSSGKTTLLKGLLLETDPSDHLVILEDTEELSTSHPNQSHLIASSEQEKRELTDYCSYAMRMRPDRIIIGEIRSFEVVPLIMAMNTGHRGCMSTIHANSSLDTLERIALLFSLFSKTQNISHEQIMKLVCKSIDRVIYIEDRKIKSIIKPLGSEGSRPYYEEIYSSVPSYP